MIAAVLLVLALSGYVFCRQYPVTRFKQLRAKSEWEFYFQALIWGFVFSSVGALCAFLLDVQNVALLCLTRFGFDINALVADTGIKLDYFKLWLWAIFSVLLAFLVGKGLSYCPRVKNKAIQSLIRENEFEQILYHSSYAQKLVQITLTSRKVYIGFVSTTPSTDNLTTTEFFSISPVFSGYREEKTMDLVLVTDYLAFYHQALDKNEADIDGLQDFKVVLKAEQVASIGYFDLKAYGDFLQLKTDKESSIKSDKESSIKTDKESGIKIRVLFNRKGFLSLFKKPLK